MAWPIAKGVGDATPGGEYLYRLSEPTDDAALCQLLRNVPMDGPVQVSLRRDPSYFEAAVVDGPHRQTLVAIDIKQHRLVAMGTRSVRRRYLQGEPAEVGYLSTLRILPEYRGRTLLARGYRKLRKLHGDGAAPIYLTTVADGNHRALNSLVGRRSGLPSYDRLGGYHTFVIPLRTRVKLGGARELSIRPLHANELPALVDFLHAAGRAKNFFPCYEHADFLAEHATFKNLPLDHVMSAWRGEQLIGTLALWNQTSFKQTVIEGYGPLLRYGRLPFNVLAGMRGWPRFPPVGQSVAAVTGALPLTMPGEESVFPALLSATIRHARNNMKRFRSLMVGAFENDPLFDPLRRASLFRYVTHVFLVHWESLARPLPEYSSRAIYLELGCL